MQAHAARRCSTGDRLNVTLAHGRGPAGYASARSRMPPAAYLQLVAATNFKQRDAQDDGVLPRRSAAATRSRGRRTCLEYDQGFFVKQGDGAADFKPIAHLYKTQVYALAEHLGVPEEIRRRPADHRHVLARRRRRRSSTSRSRTSRWTSASGRTITARRAAEVAAGRSGSPPAQVERVYRDIEAKRRASRYLHAGAAARRRARGGLSVCGIAGVRRAPRRRCRRPTLRGPRRRWSGRCATAARTSSACTATAAPGSVTPGSRSSTSPPGSSRSANEDGTLWVVFNGEIFNYVELRDELRRAGPPLPDPERHRGHRPRLRGVGRRRPSSASTASSPSRSGTPRDEALVLARDRLGVRPLYLCEHGGRLWFASEVKAIFAGGSRHPARARSGRPRRDVHLLDRRWRRRRVFQGVDRARARSRADHLAPAARRDRGFWTPRYPTAAPERVRGSLDEAVERVRAALEDGGAAAHAPRGRAGGELPLGRAGQLARRGARAAREGRAVLHLLDPVRGRRVRRDALPARGRGAHRERAPGGGRAARATSPTVFPDVVAHAERPLLRTAPAPLFLLSRLVRDAGIKVVLTGEGADEMFAGYDLFREAKVRRFWGRQPALDAAAAPPRAALSVPRPLARAQRRPWPASSSAWRAGAVDAPGFAHEPRWRSAAALQRLFSAELRNRGEPASTWWRGCWRRFHPEFQTLVAARAGPVPRDPHAALRVPALVAGRPDAHGALGRGPLPVPRPGRGRARERAAARVQAARARREARPEARGGRARCRTASCAGRSSPTARRTRSRSRAPRAPEWAARAMSERAVARRGRVRPSRRRAALAQVPHARRRASQFSNADNMARHRGAVDADPP